MNLQEIQKLRNEILDTVFVYDEESLEEGVIESRLDDFLIKKLITNRIVKYEFDIDDNGEIVYVEYNTQHNIFNSYYYEFCNNPINCTHCHIHTLIYFIRDYLVANGLRFSIYEGNIEYLLVDDNNELEYEFKGEPSKRNKNELNVYVRNINDDDWFPIDMLHDEPYTSLFKYLNIDI